MLFQRQNDPCISARAVSFLLVVKPVVLLHHMVAYLYRKTIMSSLKQLIPVPKHGAVY